MKTGFFSDLPPWRQHEAERRGGVVVVGGVFLLAFLRRGSTLGCFQAARLVLLEETYLTAVYLWMSDRVISLQ